MILEPSPNELDLSPESETEVTSREKRVSRRIKSLTTLAMARNGVLTQGKKLYVGVEVQGVTHLYDVDENNPEEGKFVGTDSAPPLKRSDGLADKSRFTR